MKDSSRTPTIRDMNRLTSWGNSVSFSKSLESADGTDQTVTGQLVGWLSPRPRVGDVFLCAMKSGKTAQLEVFGMKTYADPPDMFYAEVKFVGYLEEA
ncbi:hypothetical protein SEA_WHITNEY_83 [Gordonia phage Whitney]|nr:hypothetical protein SEA_WHITNEY_83 [Gordonia phage Whitney]WKW86366.1 hypothetical protein SEA_BUDSKI_89 [Gordonia phage Budski]